MRLIIEIDLKGAAFAGNPGDEVGRLLEKVSLCYTDESDFEARVESIRDINGNICGSVRVEE